MIWFVCLFCLLFRGDILHRVILVVGWGQVLCYSGFHCVSFRYLILPSVSIWGFPGSSEDKASACNVGDPGLIPGLGRAPGEGNGNPLQYSCLENPMDRGAWWATVHGVAKIRTQLSDLTVLYCHCSVSIQDSPSFKNDW